MSKISWNQSYSIGHETIDNQHKKWIELFNKLDTIILESDVLDLTRASLEVLIEIQDYTRHHFQYEEQVMKDIGFPELPNHWRLHKNFNYKVYEYIQYAQSGGVVLNTELLSMIKEWLLDHILQEDMKLKEYFSKPGEK